MERLQSTSTQLVKGGQTPKHVGDAFGFMHIDSYFTKEENEQRLRLRQELEKRVRPLVVDCIEKQEYPLEAFKVLAETGALSAYINTPYGTGHDIRRMFLTSYELGRIDVGVLTGYAVNFMLFGWTIDTFGSEEMRKSIMPRLAKGESIGGWGLTELNVGSDAGNVQTTCEKVEGGWKIHGNKRWVGNADREYIIVFAKDKATKKVLAFLINIHSQGVTYEVIKNKLAMRAVHNVQLHFDNVVVKDSDRLPKINSFADVNKILAHSRLLVIICCASHPAAMYENMMKYLTKRQQFGQSIMKFQLIQDKVVRVMSIAQTNLMWFVRILNMVEKGHIDISHIGLAKAYMSKNCKEAAGVARDALGGNGIISEHFVMQGVTDAEVLYTYEGTYDINSLVAGRALTGLQAFK